MTTTSKRALAALLAIAVAGAATAGARPAEPWREFRIPGSKYAISAPAAFAPSDAASALPGPEFQATVADPVLIVGVKAVTDPTASMESPAFCANQTLQSMRSNPSFVKGDFLNKTVRGVDSAWIAYDLYNAENGVKMTQVIGIIGRANERMIVCLTYDNTSKAAFETAIKIMESIRIAP